MSIKIEPCSNNIGAKHVINFLDLDKKEAKKLQDFLFNHQVKKEFIQ
jgi:hypothetical protein